MSRKSKLPPRTPGFVPDMARVEAASFYLNRVAPAGYNEDKQRELNLMAFMATVEGRPIDAQQAQEMLGTGRFKEPEKPKRGRRKAR